jgi:PhnB protein
MELYPYLMFNGNCEEAMSFYTDSLGGEIMGIERYEGSPMQVPEEYKQKVMHMTIKLPSGIIMASDTIQKLDAVCDRIQFTLNYKTLPEMQKAFDNLKRKGKVTMEIEAQFWGDYMGAIEDNYGIKWMLIAPTK